jgi:hypothetical protein
MASDSANRLSEPHAPRTGVIQQIKKEYHDTPTMFLMHLFGIGLGIAGLLFEIAAPALHGWNGVELSPSISPPARVKVGGLDFVMKISALMIVQWAVSRIHLFVQTSLASLGGPLASIAGVIACLFAAWLAIVNICWITIPAGKSPWTIEPTGTTGMVIIGLLISFALYIAVVPVQFEKRHNSMDAALAWSVAYAVSFFAVAIAVWTS